MSTSMNPGTPGTPATPPASTPPAMLRPPKLSVATRLAGVALMAVAAGGAWPATPRLQAVQGAPSLDATVPKAFGDWRAIVDSAPQIDVSQGVETVQEQPYDQTVMRTYVNSRGDQVMVALAWGERQRQDVKVHRPEVCYPAQGYFVRAIGDGRAVPTAGRAEPVPTTQLLTEARGGAATRRCATGSASARNTAATAWPRAGTSSTRVSAAASPTGCWCARPAAEPARRRRAVAGGDGRFPARAGGRGASGHAAAAGALKPG